MATGRWNPVITMLPSGLALVIGGRSGPVTPVATIEVFDAKKGRFAESGNLSEARDASTVTLLKDGRLLVAGGRVGSGALSATAEICDRTTVTCKPIGAMPEARADQTATLLADGSVLLVGGTTGGPGEPTKATASARLFLPWVLKAKP
jgi:hypothetical protein